MASAHEYQITIFSPEGKLHQVEYAFKAIKQSGLTSIGVRGGNSVAVVTEKRVGDRMVDPESVTNLFRITPHVGCLVTGRESDGRGWVSRLRQEAFEYLQQNGHQVPVDVLAMRAADIVQLYTQKASMRAYAVELMLFSVDKLLGPQLFKVDPAGHYLGYFGVTSGVKEQEAANFLEKTFKEKSGFSNLTTDQTIRLAINALQNTIGQDFKGTDIEVGAIDSETFTYRKLTSEEIESHLKVLQKFD